MSETLFIENIDFNKSDQYTLSIRLSTDGFSFLMLDSNKPIFYSIEEVDNSTSIIANLKRIFESSGYLNNKFKRVNVLFVSNRFTTLPFDLFNQDDSYDVSFYYNHPLKGNEEIVNHTVKQHNLIVLFGADKSVSHFFNEKYATVSYYHQAGIMAKYFLDKGKDQQKKTMYVSIRTGAIDVFSVEKGNLQLINTFDCISDKDRQYYLLYTWKMLNMDQENDQLYIAGSLENGSFVEELKPFIRNIQLQNNMEEYAETQIADGNSIPFDLQVFSHKQR